SSRARLATLGDKSSAMTRMERSSPIVELIIARARHAASTLRSRAESRDQPPDTRIRRNSADSVSSSDNAVADLAAVCGPKTFRNHVWDACEYGSPEPREALAAASSISI